MRLQRQDSVKWGRAVGWWDGDESVSIVETVV